MKNRTYNLIVISVNNLKIFFFFNDLDEVRYLAQSTKV